MRLIDADKLKQDVLDWQDCYNGFSDTYDKSMIIGEIDAQPTIDAVEVVRCKDCKYSKYKQVELRCCIWSITSKTKEDGYCYWGARLEGAEE